MTALAGEAGRTGAAGEGYVLPLEALSRGRLDVAGGKAANLGELLTAGLPVPGGFCVTTDAYAAVASGARLSAVLDALASTPAGDAAALERLGAAAREALLAAPVPSAVADAVREAYARPGTADGGIAGAGGNTGADVPVAVRSSATAEDLPGASFAGQQETYLNVRGGEAVLEAVRRCWASLWTDRAVAYRARSGIDPRGVRLAVVVQRQIDAAVAGVMFTANPLTGTRRQAVIDASPGLGEAVVSGAVTPDHFVVDVRSGAVLERRLGDKRLRIEALPDGGTRRVELPAKQAGTDEACLTAEQLRELARLAESVERYYGEPQDTEWAIDAAGTLWLLQSRPITTLYPLPASALNDSVGGTAGSELRVYFSFNVAQGVYQPLTPMGIQAFRLLGGAIARGWGLETADPVAGPPALVEAGHRLYLDITVPLRNRVGRRALRAALSQGEARTVELLDHLIRDPRLGPAGGSRIGTARAMARFALRSGVARGVLRALRNPEGARGRAERALERLHRSAALPESATAVERLDHFQRLLARAPQEILPNVVPLVIAGVGTFFLAQALLRGVATREELDAVRRGLPHNPTTEMDLELWALAQRIRADARSAEVVRNTPVEELAAAYRAGSLPPVAQRGVAAFLEEYGHRGVAEIDLGVPRWADDPGHILGVLANYLSLEQTAEGQTAPDAQFRRVAQEAEALVGELTRRAAARSPVHGRLVGFLLRRFRQLAGQREVPKVAIVRTLYGGRALLAPVGRELAAAGRLERGEDIYLLTLPEARAAVAGTDQRPLVRARRESMALEAQRRQIPRLILSDGTVPVGPRAAVTDGKTLEGTGASAGTVTGVARVILDPHGARLEPGEILVAPSTDPGWTPLFLTAGGLVMEMGGPMSHGAIVAREYGIPAVVGVPGATERIHSGQTITVDGASGVVSLGE